MSIKQVVVIEYREIADKQYRRMGIGLSLMKDLEQRSFLRDCSYCIFVTENERFDACKFYKSLGYDPNDYRGFKSALTEIKGANKCH